MANQFYSKGIELFLEGGVDALTDTIKAELDSTTYVPNISTDQYHSTITTSGGIVAAGVALSSKTGSAGTLSAANVVWSSVSGSQAAYISLWKDTTVDATSPLIGLIDTASGLPVTPNGGNITVAWSSGQVFTLCEMLPEYAREWGMLGKLRDWLREVCGIPAALGAGKVQGERGIWLPTPKVVALPRALPMAA